MSEYMKDAGHRPMQTCDRCQGAFYCNAPSSDDAPGWTCPRCTESIAEIARLRAALGPFAEFAGVYVRNAAHRDDTTVVVAAGDMVANAPVTIADCRAALRALGEDK